MFTITCLRATAKTFHYSIYFLTHDFFYNTQSYVEQPPPSLPKSALCYEEEGTCQIWRRGDMSDMKERGHVRYEGEGTCQIWRRGDMSDMKKRGHIRYEEEGTCQIWRRGNMSDMKKRGHVRYEEEGTCQIWRRGTWNMSRLMTKSTKWSVRPEKTQISLGIHPIWY